MRRLLVWMFMGVTLLTAGLTPALASAAIGDKAKESICQGVNFDQDNSTCDPEAEKKVQSTVVKAIDMFATIIGIIAVVMMLIAGVRYVTSQGESSAINGAKNTIIYAIVGLVVAVLAKAIVQFVLTKFKT